MTDPEDGVEFVGRRGGIRRAAVAVQRGPSTAEWMAPFCLLDLLDVRPTSGARLVPITVDDFRHVVGHVARGTGATVA